MDYLDYKAFERNSLLIEERAYCSALENIAEAGYKHEMLHGEYESGE